LARALAINSSGDILCRDYSGRLGVWRMTTDPTSGARTLTVTEVPIANVNDWSYTDLNDNGVVLTDAVNPSTGVVAFGLWSSNAGVFNTFIDPSFKQGYALNN